MLLNPMFEVADSIYISLTQPLTTSLPQKDGKQECCYLGTSLAYGEGRRDTTVLLHRSLFSTAKGWPCSGREGPAEKAVPDIPPLPPRNTPFPSPTPSTSFYSLPTVATTSANTLPMRSCLSGHLVVASLGVFTPHMFLRQNKYSIKIRVT